MDAKIAQQQFLDTLWALTQEAAANVTRHHPDGDPGDDQDLLYWDVRRKTLEEVRQLWRETIGG